MIDPARRIAVTLEAQQWELTLRVMGKAPVPFEVSAPLIQEIHHQCTASSEPPSPPQGPLARGGNGGIRPDSALEQAGRQAPGDRAA